MIAPIVRWAAIIASVFVGMSFVLFATDQTSNASDQQVRAITGGGDDVDEQSVTKLPNPDPDVERLREQENGDVHEFIDDGNDILVSPFTGLYEGDSIWVHRAVSGGIALLLYGFLGLYLARAIGLKRW